MSGNVGGARVSDITCHSNLDMKPRRLMPRALANICSIQKAAYVRLGDIADVESEYANILDSGKEKYWRLVEGLDIRAVEGFVVPGHPARAWQIAERKTKSVYRVRYADIIIGLVRPERRNIGMMLANGDDIIGSPDGIAVVRIKPEKAEEYPQDWLFAALRSEACRLQFWTESGGTSYGKLTDDMILNVLVPSETRQARLAVAKKVRGWSQLHRDTSAQWGDIGLPEDRYPVVNSPSFGLIDIPLDIDTDDDE